ncbi:FAD-linked oxidase C-terminal domain-containing protein [Siminovitchia fortis]|uniref:D-lactate dehydrogenase (cytochrome) n=1 Tax=Siminovitchia fortis TaxID=254758 RepID=A0A443IN89_9BACI|nr:FAD-linked oxidase C-terminal domain-containing protein [Siminovitchia fortis]RWR07522.1 FAD-binding protein [Siminovitchia fortis]WHY81603.1 FAD-linked oxidase C-terminal domain-containing protein [Siminovitchia fortis]
MDIYTDLCRLIGADQTSVNETILRNHSKDESDHAASEPDVVVFPESSEDVQKVLRYANKHKIPVVPFGAGSGLEGQAIPVNKGISIDFERMNKVIEVRPEDLVVIVQPGITRIQLNEELKRHGLFFPVDPGADATIGGMASTNASGTMTVRYGGMRDQVLNLKVVLADGRIIETGSLAKKSSSGLHLNGLFVGSEGTLGVFTEIALKLHGIPEDIVAARCSFPSVKSCVEAATAILTAGVPMARMELVDARSIRQANEYSDTDYVEAPSLFFEFHGNKGGNKEDIEFVRAIVEEAGCLEFLFETDSLKRAALWKARHELNYAYRHGNPQLACMTTDVCVPISKLAENVEFASNKLDEYGFKGGVVGHVGDGNFHTMIMYDPKVEGEFEKAVEFNHQMVKLALKSGGTCTGEHGVGLGKIDFQREEHGEAMEIMLALKRTLDPNQILNPGKIFPEE